MTATLPDLDLADLIADTEGEIVRLVQDRDPPPTGCTRWSATTSRSTGPAPMAASGSVPCSASWHTRRSPAITEALPGAAAVELGHNFSLVHDDIEDGDRERRHRATLWTMHGIPQAINTGDTLFSLSRIALHRLTDLGFSDAKVLRLMRLFDETCLRLCEGQYIDIATSESDELMSVDDYFDMIGRKTAALIAGSIEAGAVLATDDEAVIARYRQFGWALGLAFQINDDLLGIWGAEQATGKEPSDVAHRKKTLPVIYAARARRAGGSGSVARPVWPRRPSAAEVKEIIEILERVGARDYTRDEARRYRDEALAELDAAGVVAAGGPGATRGDHRRGRSRPDGPACARYRSASSSPGRSGRPVVRTTSTFRRAGRRSSRP